MPSRWAAASALIVWGRSAWASKAGTPRRSRSAATHRRPGQTVRRLAAHAVHGDGELAIRPLAAEPANDLDGAGAAVLGIAARSSSRDPNLGVAPADPVDQEHGFMGCVVEIDDDLLDQQAHDPLLGAGVGLDGVPDPRQVAGQAQQGLAIDPRPRLELGVQPGDASSRAATRSSAAFHRASSSRASAAWPGPRGRSGARPARPRSGLPRARVQPRAERRRPPSRSGRPRAAPRPAGSATASRIRSTIARSTRMPPIPMQSPDPTCASSPHW